MTWSEAKENFQRILNEKHEYVLYERKKYVRHLRQNNFFEANKDSAIKQYDFLLKNIEKSEQFLSNLEEMKDCCTALTDEFLTQFLNSSISVIKNPNNTEFYPELYKELSKNLELFSQIDLTADKDIARKNLNFYFDAILYASFCIPFLIAMIVTGIYIGPLAMAIPAVALVAAIAVIAFSAYKMNKNSLFINDEQKNEISAFVKDIDPSAAIEAQEFDEENKQISSLD